MIIRQKSHPFGWLFCFPASTLYTVRFVGYYCIGYLNLLEATFAKCSPYSKDEKICGLRPRIKRPVVPSDAALLV